MVIFILQYLLGQQQPVVHTLKIVVVATVTIQFSFTAAICFFRSRMAAVTFLWYALVITGS